MLIVFFIGFGINVVIKVKECEYLFLYIDLRVFVSC